MVEKFQIVKVESSAFAFVCLEISNLLKLDISTLLKLENSCLLLFSEGLKFQALEGLKSNVKTDDSSLKILRIVKTLFIILFSKHANQYSEEGVWILRS